MPKIQPGVSAVTSSEAAIPDQLASCPSLFWGCRQEKAACTSLLSFQGTLGAFTFHSHPARAGEGPTITGQVVPSVTDAFRVSPGKNDTAEVGEKRDADPLAAEILNSRRGLKSSSDWKQLSPHEAVLHGDT